MGPNLPLALLLLALSSGCTQTTEQAQAPTRAGPQPETANHVVLPAEGPETEDQAVAPRTVSNAPRRCDEEPPLPHMALPATMRVSKERRSLALLEIDADAIHVTPSEDADHAALSELRALIRQAESEQGVTYRYVRRPDRGSNGGENCLATTSRQSPRFALAFAHYLRSYDFRWMWDPAYYPR